MAQSVMLKAFKSWLFDRCGNTTTVFALAALPLLFGVGMALEMGGMSGEKTLMQDAADAGALAAASQLNVVSQGGTQDALIDTAVNTALSYVADKNSLQNVVFTAVIDIAHGTVTVTGSAEHKPIFNFSDNASEPINVEAVAETLNQTPLCILQTGGIEGLILDNTAQITATGCGVHANSKVDVAQTAMIRAGAIQAVGTAKGITSPMASTGAMPIADPFASMNLNPPVACPLKPVVKIYLDGTTTYLPPGVHCELIQVTGSSRIVLLPGEHYFSSRLMIQQNATLSGDDVVLIFGGDDKFDFGDTGNVILSARRSGPFSGFLIATGRDNTQTFSISSDRVSKLLGTIYIPNARLEISTAGNVAQDSAWSVIVAQSIVLKQNPILVINKNYIGSGVPVPEGVGPTAAAPRLAK